MSASYLKGMLGVGDNIHQRAIIVELLKRGEVWLEACQFTPFLDLVERGLWMRRGRGQRMQERVPVPVWKEPPRGLAATQLNYQPAEIIAYGSILKAMFKRASVEMPERPDFKVPVRDEWRARSLKAFNRDRSKPLLVYRPITLNPIWHCPARAPDPRLYRKLYDLIRARRDWQVVSVADMGRRAQDQLVGQMPPVDVELHRGQLEMAGMLGLFAEADLVLSNPGFAPIMAQAVGTPGVILYGGNECWRDTNAVGAHLAPTLAFEPEQPCACHNCHCRKAGSCRTSVRLDRERLEEFVDQAANPPPRVLVFGTTYVETTEAARVLGLWAGLHGRTAPGCPLMLVDSASPSWAVLDASVRVVQLGDNIGHLGRRGRDGWGRAFTYGLGLAMAEGYDYVVHIEGDALFRQPILPLIRHMQDKNLDVLTMAVRGTKFVEVDWIETAVMLIRVGWLRESGFIQAYAWEQRRPNEAIEHRVFDLTRGARREMAPWRGGRDDRKLYSMPDIAGLDFLTHAPVELMEAFALVASPDVAQIVQAELPLAGGEATPPPRPPVKLNFGCGSNRLKGWENYDAERPINRPLRFQDGYADYIFAEHCIEHVTFYEALSFLQECHRVLRPGGVIRIAVPSVEQIMRKATPEYAAWTCKFKAPSEVADPTTRGAMTNILFRHGHQSAWTAGLLESALYYVGFDKLVTDCRQHVSDHEELRNVEGHHRIIGEEWNAIETVIMEGTKPLAVERGGPVRTDNHVAIVVGGSAEVMRELAAAKALVAQAGCSYTLYVTNDVITLIDEEVIVCSLHPDKVPFWLRVRADKGYPPPREIWSHRPPNKSHVTTHSTPDWSGSSGLFAFAVTRKKGETRVIFAGVPMVAEAGHVFRQIPWQAVVQFRRNWEGRWRDIKPYARSMSGWTAEKLGTPTLEWLQEGLPESHGIRAAS